MSKTRPLAALTTPSEPDALVPDPVVWRELGVTPMTGWRYARDPDLGFPAAIKIRHRNFRSRRALEDWKAKMVRRSTAQREQRRAKVAAEA